MYITLYTYNGSNNKFAKLVCIANRLMELNILILVYTIQYIIIKAQNITIYAMTLTTLLCIRSKKSI